MTGERLLPASRVEVWRALNDPAVLHASIPGCKTLVLEAAGVREAGEPEAGVFVGKVAVDIGSIAAEVTGNLAVADPQPPGACRLVWSGESASAGKLQGDARLTLIQRGSERGEATLLAYTATGEAGGAFAELDPELVQASAQQIADEFFTSFATQLAAQRSALADAPLSVIAPKAGLRTLGGVPANFLGYPLFAWVAAAVFLFIFYNLFGGYL